MKRDLPPSDRAMRVLVFLSFSLHSAVGSFGQSCVCFGVVRRKGIEKGRDRPNDCLAATDSFQPSRPVPVPILFPRSSSFSLLPPFIPLISLMLHANECIRTWEEEDRHQ